MLESSGSATGFKRAREDHGQATRQGRPQSEEIVPAKGTQLCVLLYPQCNRLKNDNETACCCTLTVTD